jgi:hypothetical protein
MAVEQVMRTGGLKCNRQGVAFNGTIDDTGSLQIFGEEVVPGVHLFGVNQEDGTCDFTGFGKVFFSALRDIRYRDVSTGRKSWGPGDGNCAQRELLGRNHRHSSGAFRPRCLDGEIFRVNAVRARGLERGYSPIDCLLHGRRAGNAAANLVGKLLQVGFD